jgi:hypothetical protein
VVDVAHDGDHRRTRREVVVAALVLAEVDVEGLEQLAVLLLGRDDLDLEADLRADQLQDLLVDRLGRGDHLADREGGLHQRGRVGADLLAEVHQGRTAGEPDDLPVAARQHRAADGRRLHVVELLPALLLGLPSASRTATAGTAEGALRAGAAATTAAATAAAGTTGEAAATAAGSATATAGTAAEAAGTRAEAGSGAGTRAAATGTRRAAAAGRTRTAGSAGTAAAACAGAGTRAAGTAAAGPRSAVRGGSGTVGHHARVGPGAAAGAGGAGTRGHAGTRSAGHCALGTAGSGLAAGARSLRTRRLRPGHAGRTRGEGVVAGTRSLGAVAAAGTLAGAAGTRSALALALALTLAGRTRARLTRFARLALLGVGPRRGARLVLAGLRGTVLRRVRGGGGRRPCLALVRRCSLRSSRRNLRLELRGLRNLRHLRLRGGRRGTRRGARARSRTRTRTAVGGAVAATRHRTRLRGRPRRIRTRRGGGTALATLGREGISQLAFDWRLDRRGRRTDELTEVLKLGHDDLALNTQILGEFIDPDLGHFTPVFGPRLLSPRDRRCHFMGVLIAGCSSRAHDVSLPASA